MHIRIDIPIELKTLATNVGLHLVLTAVIRRFLPKYTVQAYLNLKQCYHACIVWIAFLISTSTEQKLSTVQKWYTKTNFVLSKWK